MDKFRYIICNQPDNNIYMKQREALFRHINGLKLVEELTDVDNSKYSVMEHEKGEIVLKNSFYHGEVRIESDFDISPYFEWIYIVDTLRQGVFFSEQITILKAAI